MQTETKVNLCFAFRNKVFSQVLSPNKSSFYKQKMFINICLTIMPFHKKPDTVLFLFLTMNTRYEAESH